MFLVSASYANKFLFVYLNFGRCCDFNGSMSKYSLLFNFFLYHFLFTSCLPLCVEMCAHLVVSKWFTPLALTMSSFHPQEGMGMGLGNYGLVLLT